MIKILFSAYIVLLFASCKMTTSADKQFDNTDPSKTYRLHLTPAAGSMYEYETKNESDVVMKVNGEEIHVINRVTIGTNYSIGRDTAGNFLITVSYNKIQLYAKNTDGESEMDAANGSVSANPVEKMLGILKNAKMVTTVSPTGQIRNTNGYKELTDTILAKFASASAPERQAAEKQWNQLVGDGIIRKNINQLFQLFPDSAIHVGDKWKMDISQDGELGLKTKAIYTLKDIDNNIAFIKVAGKLFSDSAATNFMNYQVSTQLQGDQDGEYNVDMATGMLQNGNVSAKVEGAIQVMGRDVPVTIKNKLQITGKKIK